MKHLIAIIMLSLISLHLQATTLWKLVPSRIKSPADNKTTNAKVELGKMLFMDPRFSSTGTVSCNTCHNLMEGGDDSRVVSMGVHGKTGKRNAPTVWNAAIQSVQFWDGRAATLEDQAKGPVTNPVEMGMKDLETAMQRVEKIPGYKAYFEKAFGEEGMTIDNAAKAVAAFERTLLTPNSPFDKLLKGKANALNGKERRGMKTFATIGCFSCHSGQIFSGPKQKPGIGNYAKFPMFENKYTAKYKLDEDKGREEVTGKKEDRGVFRIPTLRNITDTAPYFHNGSVNDLSEVVRIMGKAQLNKDLSEKDVSDIVAFLGTLTGEYPPLTMPRLPASPGSSILVEKK